MVEFLELGFYWAALSDDESFARLLGALEDRGVSIGTRAVVAPARPFGMLLDQDALETVEWDPALLSARDGRRVIEVHTGDPLGGRGRPGSALRFVGISDHATAVDHHPVAIMLDAARAEGRLRRYFALLCELAVETGPSYAAMTVEDALGCPADLRRERGTSAFCDFFVSERFVGAAALAEIRRLFADARVEDAGDGTCFSTTNWSRPRPRTAEELERSTAVARLIGARSREGSP